MSDKHFFLSDTQSEVTILEGKALEHKYPNKIILSGNIQTVSEFLRKRYKETTGGTGQQVVDKQKAILIVEEEKMRIQLLLDPENPFGVELTGVLEFTPELTQFHINSNTTFTREELIKLIKFNKRLFKSAEKHDQLLKAYQTLSLQTTGDLKSMSDTRGNREILFKKQIKSENIPEEFTLTLPIFKGQALETFRVEICLDATDASVRFWFESVELADLIEARKREIFFQELKEFGEFVTIYK